MNPPLWPDFEPTERTLRQSLSGWWNDHVVVPFLVKSRRATCRLIGHRPLEYDHHSRDRSPLPWWDLYFPPEERLLCPRCLMSPDDDEWFP